MKNISTQQKGIIIGALIGIFLFWGIPKIFYTVQFQTGFRISNDVESGKSEGVTDWKVYSQGSNNGWYFIELIRSGSDIFCSTDSKRYLIYKDDDYVKIVTKDGVMTLDNWKCYPTKQDFVNGMEAYENAQKERIKELEKQKAELEAAQSAKK